MAAALMAWLPGTAWNRNAVKICKKWRLIDAKFAVTRPSMSASSREFRYSRSRGYFDRAFTNRPRVRTRGEYKREIR
jgi:hypothetical protein